jgi:hypothetical protein
MMAGMALEEPAGDARAADNNNKKYLKRCGPDSKEIRAFSFPEAEDLRRLLLQSQVRGFGRSAGSHEQYIA